MAERIDRAQIAHVAELASLSLTDAEADKMTRELGAILAYVDELESVDTSQVPPTAHVQLAAVALRADEPRASLPRDEALAQAPRQAQDGFAVPAFVESE